MEKMKKTTLKDLENDEALIYERIKFFKIDCSMHTSLYQKIIFFTVFLTFQMPCIYEGQNILGLKNS